MEELKQIDHWLFAHINLEWTNAFLDWFFPAITDLHKAPWFIVTASLLLVLWIWKRRMNAVRWILILALSIGATDALSYRVLKPLVSRERPAAAGVTVQLRSHDHSGLSFPSNHAINIFAAATTLSSAFPIMAPLFFTTAFLVAYSRVYVGVHFPLDVFVGAILGVAIALFVQGVFRFILDKKRRTMRIQM